MKVRGIFKGKFSGLLAVAMVFTIFAAVFGMMFTHSGALTAHAADVSSINTPYPYNLSEFDNYTDNDLLYQPTLAQAGLGINNYRAQLFRNGSTATTSSTAVNVSVSSDDPIVKIVPRQLFEQRGTYLHIGREYGFYVNTTQLNTYENKSVVLVFDIIKYPLNNSNYPSQYVIEIRPIFEYTYYYLTANNNYASGNSLLKYNVSSLSSVVVAVPTVSQDDYGYLYYYYNETITHFIKDVSFGVSLYNEQELNIGDSGYNKNADNGSFITRANVNFSGVGNQSLIGATVWSTVKFGLGFVSYLGEAISILEYGIELVQNASSDFRDSIEYGDYYNTQYYNSKQEQLAHYSNLNKSAVAQLLSDDEKPLLFGRSNDGNYVRGVFTLGMTGDWYTRVIDTIKLSVVTESTNLLGNSTITSRATIDRSARTNIMSLQNKPLTHESTNSFILLSKGITKYSFAAAYASDYTITIANAAQMNIKIDNVVATFSGNQLTKALTAGTHIIEVQGLNTSKLSSSITIAPKIISASTANTTLTIPANANYLVKVTSLAQVKSLGTGNSNVVIKEIFTNTTWNKYVSYGTISPTSKLTHPFVSGNYYVLLENKISSTVSISFSIATPSTLSSSLSLTLDGDNYTYVKFVAPETAEYAISLSTMTGASFIVRKNDTALTNTAGGYFPGYFYKDSFNAGSTYYIGIKNGQKTSNVVKINKTGVAYQWQITGGTSLTTSEKTCSLTRNATYTLALFVNGVKVQNVLFEYVNQNTSFGNYIFNNLVNNQIKLDANTPIGGNGISVYVHVLNSDGQYSNINRINIIPQFEATASITSMINSNDMQFTYFVPKFVTGFDYKIYPSSTVFTFYLNNDKITRINVSNKTGGTQGTASFLTNYNTLGYTSTQTLFIDIVRIHYVDGFSIERSVDKSILSSYSMPNLFGGGTGSSTSPFLISSVRHFNNIAKTASYSSYYYKQTADLDFNGTSHALQTKSFWGAYDGKAYSLNNISLSIPTMQYGEIGGFCGRSCGTIKNLKIKNLHLFATNPSNHDDETNFIYAGGVSGINQGLLYNVDLYNSNVLIHRMKAHVGGVTGYNFGIQGSYYYTVSSRNYNVYNCDFGYYDSSSQYSKVHSNGHTGGIAGINYGNLYSCYTGSNTTVMLYQIGENNKVLGGIAGYNSNGYVVYCNNYAKVAYDPDTPVSKSTNINPYIGKIAGINYGSNNLIDSYCGGSISTGSLKSSVGGFLGIGSHNQMKYVGAYYNQGIGLNNP
jgi:hypothetical protein